MLVAFYVLLVWIKIIVTMSVVVLWLWIARDRGATGWTMALNEFGAFVAWVAPWAMFLWNQADLYHGKCGLRLGVHDCGLIEFLWGQMQWLRLGLLLDVMLFVGAIVLISRARPSNGTNSGALRMR